MAAPFHGYKSSQAWLKRAEVVTSPTGKQLIGSRSVPTNFDWRNVNGRSYVTADLNQHVPQYCGACWIHGTTSTLSDRVKIMRKANYPEVMLSRQALLNCVPDPSGKNPPPGCNGGDAYSIHKYLHDHKVPDETCMPYTAANMGCEANTVCRNCQCKPGWLSTGAWGCTPGPCLAITSWAGYGVGDYGNVSGEDAMMKEIFARGPITCNFVGTDEFMFNSSENVGVVKDNVYVDDKPYTQDDVDHVIELTGWGETASGTKYWVVRNSWGTYWGDKGWIKIRRGVNQQMIESGCDWAVPDFDDLNEELSGKVLGDYLQGVTVDSGSQDPHHLSSLSDTISSNVGPSWISMVMVALVSCAFGAAFSRSLSKRSLPREQLLLG